MTCWKTNRHKQTNEQRQPIREKISEDSIQRGGKKIQDFKERDVDVSLVTFFPFLFKRKSSRPMLTLAPFSRERELSTVYRAALALPTASFVLFF